MLSMRMSFLLLAASCILFLGFGQQAAAQCAPGSSFFGVALQAGNPFQAEQVTTFTSKSEGKDGQPLRPAELIARDGQGRLRIETTEGKFKVDEGEGAGTEAVQQIITICDPVSQKLVRLDTLSKTATVQGRPAGSVRSGTQAQAAFCSLYANKKSVGNT